MVIVIAKVIIFLDVLLYVSDIRCHTNNSLLYKRTLVHIVPAAAAKQVVLTFYSFLGVNSEIEEQLLLR